MPVLLLVHHTPSPALDEILDALTAGAGSSDVREAMESAGQPAPLEIVVRPALVASEQEVMAADGYVLSTPANFGYMAGALKHFFDRVYYPVKGFTAGRPVGLVVHGNLGTEGAVRSVESIVSGLQWRWPRPPLHVRGKPDAATLEEVRDLAGLVGLAAAGVV